MAADQPVAGVPRAANGDGVLGRSSGSRIVWVEDHQFVTDSGSMLLREAGFDLVAIVADGESLLRSYGSLKPDITLCDMALPGQFDGISLTKTLLAQDANARVVIFSADNRGPHVLEAILAGAVGYLDKTLGVSAVVDYLRRSISEPFVFDPMTLANFVAAVSASLNGVDGHVLSPRDRVVLQLLVNGEDTNAIANKLHVSVRTAKRTLTALYQSFGVSNRREAIARRLVRGSSATSQRTHLMKA